MISDLDETLKQLLIKKVPLEPAEVYISFEAPDREWAASISKPTVNLYLYDIRENHQLRAFDWSVERNQNRTATKKRTPLRIDLSYLVTVWTNDVEDEHRLLWHVLATLLRHQTIPAELLQGALAAQELPIPTATAQPDGALKKTSDFWNALDNRLKPSIDYVVTVPLDLEVLLTAPVVRTKLLRVGGAEGMTPDELIQVLGMVRAKEEPAQGVPEATVVAKEVGMTAKSDATGRYIFPKLPPGSYTFRVSAPGREEREIAITIPSDNYDLEL
jgi:hypothetical protein